MLRKNPNRRTVKKITIDPTSSQKKSFKKPIRPPVNPRKRSKVLKKIPPQQKVAPIKKQPLRKNVPKAKTLYPKIGHIDPLFKGETVYLVGGGPSLKGFDFDQLNNKNTVVINKAFLFYPKADVLYWTDSRFYDWYPNDIHRFDGLKVTNKHKPIKYDIINLQDTGRTGLDTSNSALRHGNNSGYAAINLAVHLGAKTIVLLGYDMRTQGVDTHWHDGYKINKSKHSSSLYKRSMVPHFSTLVQPLKELGIKVWNANPESHLDCFPKCSLEKGLMM